MAAPKKKTDVGKTLLGALAALGTGFGVTAGMNALDTNVDMYRKNPSLAPLTGGGLGLGALFLLPDDYAPIGYGALGAVGSDVAGDLVNGFSRVEVDSSMNQDDLDDMEEGDYGNTRDPNTVNDHEEEEDGEVTDADFDEDSDDGTGG